MSSSNSVEVLQIAPARKHRHSIDFFRIRYLSLNNSVSYLVVNFPFAPFSSRTLSVNTHRCFPHFPKSSECRVSYEYARYGSENRKSQRKCYCMRFSVNLSRHRFEWLTSMLCMPLSLRIFSFALLVFAFEARVSTARMDCGVRSSKLPEILCKSICATRHLGHG